jgi:probable phosphoglycerate mutase
MNAARGRFVRDIYVVTHTEAQHHVDDLVGGWYDSSLTERGQRQAVAVADRLAELIDATPLIVSSDLARTRETAESIAARFDTDFTSTGDLREMSQGSGEGKPQAWFDERFTPAPEDNRLDHRSYEDGETKREMMTRIYRGMDAVLEDEAPVQVVVTHGFALTFVIAAWVKMPLEAAGYINVRATSGGITHLHEDDFFRNRQIRSLNETSHLDGS